MRIVLLILLVGSCCARTKALARLETIYEWPLLPFDLPHEEIFDSKYILDNAVPTGIAISNDRVFVSVPRLRAGVASTLNYIPRSISPGRHGRHPLLQPYPSWEWHRAGPGGLNCSQLISVYRSQIDRCNRLWVVDSGVMTSIDDFRPICPPKIMIFDLLTDQLVRMYTFPREVLRPNTLLTNLIIDDATATTCDNVFVYMSDTTGPGIVVFNVATEKSWRVVHASMYPDPDFSTYRIGNDMFELMDGIVGLAYSAKLGLVYFQPLATTRIFSVPTSALRTGPLAFGEQLPVTILGTKSSQGLALAFDPRDDGILFAPLTETIIASYRPHTGEHSVLVSSFQDLQFVAEIRWVEQDGSIWVMSTRFQKFFRREYRPNVINVRIMKLIR